MVLNYIRSTKRRLRKTIFQSYGKMRAHTYTSVSIEQIGKCELMKESRKTKNKTHKTRYTFESLAIDHRTITIRAYDWISLFVLIAEFANAKWYSEWSHSNDVKKSAIPPRGYLRAMRERRLQQRRLIATSVHWRKVYSLNNIFFVFVTFAHGAHWQANAVCRLWWQCVSAGAWNIKQRCQRDCDCFFLGILCCNVVL